MLTSPFQVIGSPYYMAPEQMRSGQPVDARADIWALGVVLYELCTGRTPFSADSIPGVCAMVLDENPAPPRALAASLPRGLERVILRCLRKQPERRYQSVADLAEALAHFGPEHAGAYAERIARVIASSRPDHGKGQGPEQLATQRSIGARRLPAGDSVPGDVAIVESPLSPLSLAATVRAQQRARLGSAAELRQAALVVATAAGISMLASMALFEFGARGEDPAAAVQTAAAAPAPLPKAPPEPPGPPPQSGEALEVAGDPELRSPPPAPTEVKRPACADRPRPSAARTAAPHSPKPTAREPEQSPAPPPELDPFDPDNFGGRQ